MSVIYNQDLNVRNIFEEAVLDITEKISSVRLEKTHPININNYNMTSIVMYSVGVYNSMTVCYLESELLFKIILKMSMEEILLKEDMELYMKEYVNIVCGRAISDINNLLGKTSRFTVPDIHEGVYVDKDLNSYDNKEELFYDSEFGILKVLIAYKLSNDVSKYSYAN